MKYQFLLFMIIESTSGARILGIFPLPVYSHQSVFQPLWRELSIRGHEVTVITAEPLNDQSLTNLTEIDLSFTHKLVFEDNQMLHLVNTESNILVLMAYAVGIMRNMTATQLQHPHVQQLIKSNKEFDLLIMEAHVPAWYGFAKRFKCPIVAITSMDATNHFKRLIGNVNNPVFSSHMNLPFEQDLSFFQRVVSVLFEVVDEFQTNYIIYPAEEKLIKEAMHDNDIDLFKLRNNISLFMVVVIPGFHKGVTKIPSVVQLNGLQIKPPQRLPNELLEFLDGANDGVVYFSLGSIVRSSLIPYEKQAILMEVFRELPFKVIWKFQDALIDDLPPNVKLLNWAPQQDILRHRNTKLFITQGGLQSIEEAIRFRVPMLGIPFFGDQFFNAKRVNFLQIGTWMDFTTLNKHDFKHLILQSINNETYLKNLEELSDLLQPPERSLEKAVWWIEYVIRNKGIPHLRSPIVDMPFYQYYLLDVIAFVIFTIVAMSLMCVKTLRFVRHRNNFKKAKLP